MKLLAEGRTIEAESTNIRRKDVAGEIKRLLDLIIEQRSRGSETIRQTTRVKLMLKGVPPDRYNQDSPDDPEIIARLKTIASEMGVEIEDRRTS